MGVGTVECFYFGPQEHYTPTMLPSIKDGSLACTAPPPLPPPMQVYSLVWLSGVSSSPLGDPLWASQVQVHRITLVLHQLRGFQQGVRVIRAELDKQWPAQKATVTSCNYNERRKKRKRNGDGLHTMSR